MSKVGCLKHKRDYHLKKAHTLIMSAESQTQASPSQTQLIQYRQLLMQDKLKNPSQMQPWWSSGDNSTLKYPKYT